MPCRGKYFVLRNQGDSLVMRVPTSVVEDASDAPVVIELPEEAGADGVDAVVLETAGLVVANEEEFIVVEGEEDAITDAVAEEEVEVPETDLARDEDGAADEEISATGGESDPGTDSAVTLEAMAEDAEISIFHLWYFHPPTETIRTKAGDYCLDIIDDKLLVTSYQADRLSQVWKATSDHAVSQANTSLVLDVRDDNEADGPTLCLSVIDSDSETQKWDFIHQEADYFYIVSAVDGKVMDIEKQNTGEGADVVMYARKGGDNQLWYEDKTSLIRSKLNNYFPEATKDGSVRMFPYDEYNPRQNWVISGDNIRNLTKENDVLDIRKGGALSLSHPKVAVSERSDQASQRWIFEKVEPE